MSQIVVGVDAGGTSCIAARALDGAIERVATHGPANASSSGVEAAAATMIAAIEDVMGGPHPAAIYIGAAGAGRAERVNALRSCIAVRYPQALIGIGDDALIALRAAIPEGPGIVLIAGTGSIAFADNGTTTARSGGLGYLIGDEGSGFSLGIAALRLLAKVYDGRAPNDELVTAIARSFGEQALDGLLEAVYVQPVPIERIAAVAPVVIALASGGDRAATRLVQAHAGECADLVKAAARKAGMIDSSPSVALMGGLLRENSVFSYLLQTRITGDIPGVDIMRANEAPYVGAVRLAQRLL